MHHLFQPCLRHQLRRRASGDPVMRTSRVTTCETAPRLSGSPQCVGEVVACQWARRPQMRYKDSPEAIGFAASHRDAAARLRERCHSRTVRDSQRTYVFRIWGVRAFPTVENHRESHARSRRKIPKLRNMRGSPLVHWSKHGHTRCIALMPPTLIIAEESCVALAQGHASRRGGGQCASCR